MNRNEIKHRMMMELLGNCNEAIALEPNNLDLIKTRGIVLNIIEKYKEAIRDFSKVLRTSTKDTACYYLRSESYFQLGDYAEAKRDFLKAVNIEQNKGLTTAMLEDPEITKEIELADIKEILAFERQKAIRANFPSFE
ncbi:MAG: tetratricopeptide repeat protein [Bacteroidia bacterium]|nr:tetratricopeptide repeat protein [Bacteroidia bacterium]